MRNLTTSFRNIVLCHLLSYILQLSVAEKLKDFEPKRNRCLRDILANGWTQSPPAAGHHDGVESPFRNRPGFPPGTAATRTGVYQLPVLVHRPYIGFKVPIYVFRADCQSDPGKDMTFFPLSNLLTGKRSLPAEFKFNRRVHAAIGAFSERS